MSSSRSWQFALCRVVSSPTRCMWFGIGVLLFGIINYLVLHVLIKVPEKQPVYSRQPVYARQPVRTRKQWVHPRPNIVFVLADDLGFHDVGYHDSRIRTPNLDRLASEGVKLENYYVQPICSPTRSQLLSGRYQIHTGLQHSYIRSTQPNALPLNSPTIAEVLKSAHYSTHMMGKWHLGFYLPEYLPINRGFDSFYGYLTGREDYYTHENAGYLDLYDNLKPVFNETGHYSAHLFSQKASDVIQAHDPTKGPLFLYLSYQSVHAPLQVPERYLDQYNDIQDARRRTFAGMVTCMDEGIGNVTTALKDAGLWDNTVFIFSTDNGGHTKEGGNNFPLRGEKHTLWEGGVRGIGFVHSNLLRNKGRVSKGLIHVSDWFPTLAGIAGASLNGTLPLDGYDQWKMISENAPSQRTELLHNIDPLYKPIGSRLYPDIFDTRVRAAIRVGDYKLITGDPGQALWTLPPERQDDPRTPLSLHPTSNPHPHHQPDSPPPIPTKGQSQGHTADFVFLRNEGNRNKNVWLFNITEDPEERHDLSASKPEVVRQLLQRLQFYNFTAVPCRFPDINPMAKPQGPRGVWGPWMEKEEGEREVDQQREGKGIVGVVGFEREHGS